MAFSVGVGRVDGFVRSHVVREKKNKGGTGTRDLSPKRLR